MRASEQGKHAQEGSTSSIAWCALTMRRRNLSSERDKATDGLGSGGRGDGQRAPVGRLALWK
jgi:hypothetical protein